MKDRLPNQRSVWPVVLLGFLLWPILGQAQLVITRSFSVGEAIPDGGELLNAPTVNLGDPIITEVQVGLDLSGRGSGGFNGDVYATLGHGTGFTVLLNRPGKQTPGGLGYSDSGLQVTFADSTPNSGDVHVYRQQLFGNDSTPLTGPLTGRWQPDGRQTDPDDVLATDPRTAMLSSFVGQPASGEWRLFLADMSAGGVSDLDRWKLRITIATDTMTLLRLRDDVVSVADQSVQLNAPIILDGRATISSAKGLTFAGQITGNGGLTQEGPGVLTLSHANDYSGGTFLNGGCLSVKNQSGSATGTGPVVINSGGTLAGSGAIAGSVTVNSGGTIAPGNSPGTLHTGSQTWNGGGHYLWQINQAASAAGTDPGWAVLDINGSLTIGAGAENRFSIDLVSLTQANAAGPVHDFDSQQRYTWSIVAASGGITGFDPEKFLLNTGGFANALNNGSFSLSQSGNDLDLTFVPVPEPGAFGLAAALGLAGFTCWRRLSRRAPSFWHRRGR